MRKIGIVSEYFYPHLGGITEHVYYYAKELVARGFDVTILTGYEGSFPNVALPPALKIVHLGRSVPIFSNNSFAKVTIGWDLGKKIKQLLQQERFDILHIHSPTFPVLPVLFQKYSNTVTIGTLHTYFESIIYYKLLKKYVQRYVNHLDGIIAVSPSCIDAMSQYFTFKEGAYRIIPNGVNVEWFATPTGTMTRYSDNRPTVLFLGRLDPRNGLDTLLCSFPLVLARMPQARLVIAGDGPLRNFYEERAGALLGKSIFFDGLVNETRPDYFAASRVFCYPATKASFGVTLLEAMSAGVPVVAADNPGFRNIVEDGVNGLLVDPRNPEALADALVRVIESPALAQRLADAGRRTAESFAWSRVTDQVLDYYNDVYMRKKGVPFCQPKSTS